MTPTAIVTIAVLPLVGWRLYSRIRRLVGRQRSRPWRHWATAIVFPLVLVALGLAAAARPDALAALGAATLAGVALAAWGLRLTRFERTPQGLFYTPNAHLGIAVSLVFAARVAWRLVELATRGAGDPAASQDFARSPLTLAVFGLLAGYYAAYAIGVLRWRAAHPAPGQEP